MGTVIHMATAVAEPTHDDYVCYTPAEAAQLSLVSPQRLAEWESNGVVMRSRKVLAADGRELTTGYSLRDVAYMHLLWHLRSKGVPMEDAIDVLFHLMARIDSDPESWRALSILVRNKTIYVLFPDEWGVTRAVPGPQGAGQKIEETFFADVFRDIADPGAVLVPAAYRTAIEINPRRCDGRPSFRNRGISVFAVHDLLQKVSPARVIREYYPSLSREDFRVGEHYVRYLHERRL